MSNKNYPATVAPMWKQGYKYASLSVNSEILDLLKTVEEGGQFSFKTIKDEYRKGERSPQAYLEYLTPEQVEEERLAYLASKGEGDDI